MDDVKQLTIDASAQILMHEIHEILKVTKIKKGRRSLETTRNQKIINNIKREDLLHTKHPSSYKYRNMETPLSMIVGTRWDYYNKCYTQTAHDRDYGTDLYDKIKELSVHLGNLNNLEICMNTATINKNFQCSKHKDRNNKSSSILCGFGDYTGGETVIYDASDNPYIFDINEKPIYFDGKKNYHEVLDFSGTRYSLVSYLI